MNRSLAREAGGYFKLGMGEIASCLADRFSVMKLPIAADAVVSLARGLERLGVLDFQASARQSTVVFRGHVETPYCSLQKGTGIQSKAHVRVSGNLRDEGGSFSAERNFNRVDLKGKGAIRGKFAGVQLKEQHFGRGDKVWLQEGTTFKDGSYHENVVTQGVLGNSFRPDHVTYHLKDG